MQTRQVLVTKVFTQLYNANKTIVVCRGGARSSKSYSIAQLLVQKLTAEKNKKILVSRKTMPSLKITAMRDILTLLKDYGYYLYCDHNKTDGTLTYRPTGSFIYFCSVDDPEKIKSTGWNYIWLEESTDFDHDDYMILKLRLSEPNDLMNHMYLSFNPISAFHWVKTEVVDKEKDCQEIVSTYRDNIFLSQEYIKLIEQTREQNANYWRVYGLGQWGSLEDNIYNNYKLVDAFPDNIERTIWGLDFGFNAPTALVEVGANKDGFYLKERLYQSGLTNADLIAKLKTILPSMSSRLYADSAEPARITEIKREGIACVSANKEKNSVKDGIDFCKRHNLYITKDSVNLIKEMQGYQYKKDKDGHTLDEPVKFNDHLLDAFRYAIFTHFAHKMDLSLITSGD